MMKNNFICGNKNLIKPENSVGKICIPPNSLTNINLETCLSNSFGFGGTNACLILGKF